MPRDWYRLIDIPPSWKVSFRCRFGHELGDHWQLRVSIPEAQGYLRAEQLFRDEADLLYVWPKFRDILERSLKARQTMKGNTLYGDSRDQEVWNDME